ncbi:hypothetical protein ACH5RR_000930 [Cinchona calisaya]|uniref:GIY-YIG domain-containing protein n=1 Tax=Cinchona calisaya TaxID=153742 RepID=A0ABD3B269_9GENT
MARLFSRTFKSLKPHNSDHNLKPLLKPPRTPASTPSKLEFALSSSKSPRISKNPWSVYLILSTNPPIKTYVGVTTNFSCRLKQHNGELKGGAKASRAGRPWVCACLINGFSDKSEE